MADVYSHFVKCLTIAQDSDSDLMDMADDSEFNMFLDKDSINGPHLHNGKVKMPLGMNDIVKPQLKPPPPNPPPDLKPKVPLTKDGRLQKKRGPKPGPRNQTANKRPRLTSTRPVPKMVLKNLKVGTVESGTGACGKNGNGKVSFTVFDWPVSTDRDIVKTHMLKTAISKSGKIHVHVGCCILGLVIGNLGFGLGP